MPLKANRGPAGALKITRRNIAINVARVPFTRRPSRVPGARNRSASMMTETITSRNISGRARERFRDEAVISEFSDRNMLDQRIDGNMHYVGEGLGIEAHEQHRYHQQ